MIYFLTFIGTMGLALTAFTCGSFMVSCLIEKEKRATVAASIQLSGIVVLFFAFLHYASMGFFHTAIGRLILVAAELSAGTAAYFLLRKTGENPTALQGTNGLIEGNVERFDEREVLFARNRSIRPGSKEYDSFYEKNPHLREFDEKRRAAGGPMGPIGTIDNPHADINNAMTFACLNIPAYLGEDHKVTPDRHPVLKAKLGDEKINITPEEASLRVKGYAKRLGASLVGIARLNSSWLYSKRGEIFYDNWEDWGRDIDLKHDYAIVFAEEMDLDLVGTAPHTPTNIESMYNYAKGAVISTQLASFIANLGYSATANHLRHYDALMVPLAVDAGLGEMGRMGYLLTKELGARVRLSAVTTDLPLVPDKAVDIGVDHFCQICKKCAACCPSKSIPEGEKIVKNGTKRWVINAHTCFDYWGKIGTDCNRCMMVCPWSHARTFPHKLIVFMVTRNALARKLFATMDDIFYGRHPKSKKGPDWAAYQ